MTFITFQKLYWLSFIKKESSELFIRHTIFQHFEQVSGLLIYYCNAHLTYTVCRHPPFQCSGCCMSSLMTRRNILTYALIRGVNAESRLSNSSCQHSTSCQRMHHPQHLQLVSLGKCKISDGSQERNSLILRGKLTTGGFGPSRQKHVRNKAPERAARLGKGVHDLQETVCTETPVPRLKRGGLNLAKFSPVHHGMISMWFSSRLYLLCKQCFAKCIQYHSSMGSLKEEEKDLWTEPADEGFC